MPRMQGPRAHHDQRSERVHHQHPVAVLGAIGLVTAALTAFYTFRMVFLAFSGPERIPEGVHPRESEVALFDVVHAQTP